MKNKKLNGYDDYIRYLYDIQRQKDRDAEKQKEEEERHESESDKV